MLLKGGKHGSMKVLISESQLSDDDTRDEILSTDSTYISPDETVRCDEMKKLTNESEKSKSTKYKKTRQSEM
jgi:primase-polymerase (primpol)-like protein